MKIAFSLCLQPAVVAPLPSSGNHTQHQAAVALSCGCEHLGLCCASVSQMCPKVSGKPLVSGRAREGVKLDILQHIWDNLVGYSLGLGTLTNISYKLKSNCFSAFCPFWL